MEDSIYDEYLKLCEEIKYHMNKYYNDDEPEISDYEYDMLMQKLKKIENEHPDFVTDKSPTRIIGGTTKRQAGVNVTHNVPMLSIQDVFTKEEVINFVKDVRSIHPDARFCVEQKIDGLSMSIRYRDGKLSLAETRGDGLVGEDVTENALVIPDVVKKIGDEFNYLEVRGEVYMSHEDFDKTNRLQEELGKKIFANPRNCAAGTLRQLDSSMVKQRGLSMFIFNIQESNPAIDSHSEGLSKLKELGMKTVPSILCDTEEEILSAIDMIGEKRGELGYDIDGAVIKIDQIAYRDDFQKGSKYSSGHIAYKYPPEEKETVITDIELSVGMTGRVNPTAVFNPIRLCGTTVSRATLHNQDFIDKLGIGIGRSVIVYKSGEIIPKIKAVVASKNPEDSTVYKLPDTCPICGAKLSKKSDMSDIVCVNEECPAKQEKKIINFVTRDAMDIKGFGEENIRTLISNGYIKDISDIYILKNYRDELIDKGLIGKEKGTDNVLNAIESSKNNPPERLLTGLSISNVGKQSAKSLVRHFKSIDSIMHASVAELTDVEDVGETIALGIHDFFHKEKNIEIMEKLKSYGLKMESEDTNVGDALLGKTYVITGSLNSFANRDAFIEYVEKNGGKVSGSVSKKTSALINNDKTSTSGKNKKAMELGIPIMSEEDFIKMIENLT